MYVTDKDHQSVWFELGTYRPNDMVSPELMARRCFRQVKSGHMPLAFWTNGDLAKRMRFILENEGHISPYCTVDLEKWSQEAAEHMRALLKAEGFCTCR